MEIITNPDAAGTTPLLGSDPTFLEALEHVSRLAQLDRPALVIGERGTGKELMAERLHYLSPRWDGPFAKVNCAALTETLLESELFGHEAGAFTGARQRRRGRFERADGGTLFLDEIATASSRLQEQILRVIEYGEFERVGGEQTLKVNVRVVGATNVDLPECVAAGRFRADLLDRLSFDVVTLPPLRARPTDILELSDAFGIRMAKTLGHPLFPGFTSACRQMLLGHGWPGNVRELRNVIERAVYRAGPSETPIDMIQIDPFESPWRPGNPAKIDAPSMPPSDDFSASVARFEKDLLKRALAANNGSQTNAAQQLKLSYHQLRRLLKKYGL
ncbi:sigma 54-interacting transcriptional regulator [Dongia rigui]|uniref:Sigma 54-interacting transcriptional regulator n=1 Tax=Dongia rigui TaxID=940149 RepID=A0ABU5E0A8_9PROT|nr:sigma 54-interacting transcriptional regulator [Dongia rigui]MDY0873021.1 sigma 54-interacting transcriptional regulator [Dongia rigui]